METGANQGTSADASPAATRAGSGFTGLTDQQQVSIGAYGQTNRMKRQNKLWEQKRRSNASGQLCSVGQQKMHATLIHEFFLPCIGAPSARSRAAVHAAAVCKQATQREALLPHSQRGFVKGGPWARLHSTLAQGQAALSCCLWWRSLAGRHDEGEVCLAHQVLAHVCLGSHLIIRGRGCMERGPQ